MAEPNVPQLAALETTLHEMVEAHEQMLAMLQRKREALRRADVDALAQLGAQEQAGFSRIAELEKRRANLAGQVTLQLDPQAEAPWRLHEMARRLPEPARGRLLVLRAQLQQRMQQVRDAAGVLRQASDALLSHVHGLMQSVVMAASGSSTYGRTATPPREGAAVRTINMTA